MKKFYLLCLVAVTITCLSGCQKLRDYVDNHPDADIKDCPIMQMINSPFYPFYPDVYDTLVFSYNSFGDPVSIIHLPHTTEGITNYFFKYDKKHRLTDFIGMYDNGYAEIWHRYFYENPGSSKIVVDSFYLLPLIVNGVLTPDPIRGGTAHYLTYDKKERIIKDSSHYTDPYFTGSSVNYYSYDATGNRTDHPLYDDKINIHRTNKIWMFIDKDYSVNNPFIADSYNSIGLPTRVNFPPKPLQSLGFLQNSLVDRVTYKCK